MFRRVTRIFFSWDVSRLQETAVVVFQMKYFILFSAMQMIHNFDVVVLIGDGRWGGTVHFNIWKECSNVDVSELSIAGTGSQTLTMVPSRNVG